MDKELKNKLMVLVDKKIIEETEEFIESDGLCGTNELYKLLSIKSNLKSLEVYDASKNMYSIMTKGFEGLDLTNVDLSEISKKFSNM